MRLPAQAEEAVAVANRKRPPGLNRVWKKSRTASEVPTRAKVQIFIAECLSGFENPLPRTEVRGYTQTGIFSQPVKPGIFISKRSRGFENLLPGLKSGADTEKQPARNNDC
jgi:hypothetical protein